MKNILHVVNSSIGKKGNIGLRTFNLTKNSNNSIIFTRANYSKKYFNKTYHFPFYEYISRFLNFIRIYFLRNFSSRFYDNYFFELIFIHLYSKTILKKFYKKKNRILHIWEYLPKTIKLFKNNNFKIILDVPIAPSLYSLSVNKKLKKNLFEIDERIIKLEKISFELADKIIVPSLFVKEQIIYYYNVKPSKIETVPFGVDQKQFRSINTGSCINSNSNLVFIYVGNVSTRKGSDLLIKAFNNNIFKSDQLILCGRVYPEIKDLLKKLNNKSIHAVGYNSNVYRYLRKSDVFIFPSWTEGSAKAIYEAISVGLPVICSFSSGCILNNDSAIIINDLSVNKLTDAMLELKKNHHKRKLFRQKGLKIIKDFTWENYKAEVNMVYKKLL